MMKYEGIASNKIKLAITSGVILLVIISLYGALSYADGNRLSSYEAAQASQWIDEHSVLLGEECSEQHHVYIYENDDKYRTIVTHFSFPFWRESSSFWADKTDDEVELVGWCSTGEGENGITVVPIQCSDDNVAYIEIGTGRDFIRKKISTKEMVVFSWKKMLYCNDLDAVAYSIDDEPLYWLGYERKDGATINTDEFRWVSVEQ